MNKEELEEIIQRLCGANWCLETLKHKEYNQLRSMLDEAVKVINYYAENESEPIDYLMARQFLEKYSDLINDPNRVKGEG